MRNVLIGKKSGIRRRNDRRWGLTERAGESSIFTVDLLSFFFWRGGDSIIKSIMERSARGDWNNTKGDGERKEWEWRRKEWWSATSGKPPTFRGMCNFVDVPWFYRICRALPANPDPFVNFWYEPRGSKVKEQPVSNANFLWNYSNTFLRSTIRWPYRFHSSSFSIPIISFRLKCPPLLERPLWSMRYLDLTGTKNLRKILEAKVWYANLSLSLWNVNITM